MTAGRLGDGAGTVRPARRGTWVSVAAVLLAALIGGHRWLPNVYGLGSLIDTVAPFLALGIPPLAVAALMCRARRALLLVLVPMVVWGALFGVAWWPTGGGPAGLRVVSQNLRADNPNPAATVAALAATGADLIGLQEVVPGAQDAIRDTLRERYPHQAATSTVALWSRFPIRDHVGVDIGLDWIRALRAVVETSYGEVVVYVVHLGSARAGDTATRDRTVAGLTDVLRRDSAPRLVVLGDLNTASTDRVIEPLTELLRDAQADAGRGFGFTWPAGLPLTRPDHILYRGLAAVSANVVRTPASDHRAVAADFRG